jgi:dolichyl-phosphate-mannose--protein O-mannosyl transferase
MSAGSRILIAIVSLIFAVLGAYSALSAAPESNSWIQWLWAAFFGTLSLACIPGRVGRIALRIFSASVSLLCVLVLIKALHENMETGTQAKLNLHDAIRFFCLFGMPFGYIAVFGFYPPWAAFGKYFGGRK